MIRLVWGTSFEMSFSAEEAKSHFVITNDRNEKHEVTDHVFEQLFTADTTKEELLDISDEEIMSLEEKHILSKRRMEWRFWKNDFCIFPCNHVMPENMNAIVRFFPFLSVVMFFGAMCVFQQLSPSWFTPDLSKILLWGVFSVSFTVSFINAFRYIRANTLSLNSELGIRFIGLIPVGLYCYIEPPQRPARINLLLTTIYSQLFLTGAFLLMNCAFPINSAILINACVNTVLLIANVIFVKGSFPEQLMSAKYDIDSIASLAPVILFEKPLRKYLISKGRTGLKAILLATSILLSYAILFSLVLIVSIRIV